MSYEPYETPIAPICENSCDGENCPGEDNCFRFLYFLRRERFYTQEDWDKNFGDC